MPKVAQRLDQIESRLDLIEACLAPRVLTPTDVVRERSRMIHVQRGEAWPCAECFPADLAV